MFDVLTREDGNITDWLKRKLEPIDAANVDVACTFDGWFYVYLKSAYVRPRMVYDLMCGLRANLVDIGTQALILKRRPDYEP